MKGEIVMSRPCKCFYSGEQGNTDIFVKRPVGKQHKYFKSEEVYQKFIKEKELKDKLHTQIAEILNYKDKQMLPPFLKKELNRLLDIYNLEVIIETFRANANTINYWLNQDGKFKNEANKINYMIAIIKNNINDVYKKWQQDQKIKQSSKANIDIELMDIKFENKATKSDISQFL